MDAVLAKDGWKKVEQSTDAKAILLNTCAIRDHAEEKIWGRLGYFNNLQTSRPRKESESRQVWMSPNQSLRYYAMWGRMRVASDRSSDFVFHAFEALYVCLL